MYRKYCNIENIVWIENNMEVYLPQEMASVRPVCPCVLVPDGQLLQLFALVPAPYVSTGHTVQTLLLSAFK